MTELRIKPTPRDRLTDIGGLEVGHAADETVRSGATVILPESPVVMGSDLRGGAPGTRDVAALDPVCLVERFHGLVFSGGSVFGLAAADGVTAWLSERGVGLELGSRPVPVVPAAILFDLTNGGDKDWGPESPYRELGRRAAEAATADMSSGRVGAGFGARAGDRPGGIGTAARCTDAGFSVGALVAVNAFGPPLDDKLSRLKLPKAALLATSTTLVAVATDLDLDKAACRRLAIMAHDGLARSLRPVHTPFDGDIVFAMATGSCRTTASEPVVLTIAGSLAADAVAAAVAKASAA